MESNIRRTGGECDAKDFCSLLFATAFVAAETGVHVDRCDRVANVNAANRGKAEIG